MNEPSVAELEARYAATRSDASDPVARIEAALDLAWALRSWNESRSHHLAAEARREAEAIDYRLGRARAARILAMTVLDPDAVDTVFELAEEAKQLFDEIGDPKGRAGSRDFLSSLHEYMGDLAGGLSLALDALEIARSIDDPVRQGFALCNIGGILARSGETEAGIERLEEGLQLFEVGDSLDGKGGVLLRLATVYRDVGRYEDARRSAAAASAVAQELNNNYLQVMALAIVADVEAQTGPAERAEALYRQVLGNLHTEPGRSVLGAEPQVKLGRLLMREGRLDDAHVELTDALRRSSGQDVLIVSEAAIRDALAELCERTGDLAAALEHSKIRRKLQDRIAQREARNKMAMVEFKSAKEAAAKDAEIHKLRYVELRAMQTKLVEVERMALLGKLAAGTAHELNNPLGVLRSSAALSARAGEKLVALLAASPDVAAEARRIASALHDSQRSTQQAIDRISTVTETFARFAQLDQAAARPFDVREGLESALKLVTPNLPAAVTIERSFQAIPLIDAWPHALNQAFLTVLNNALEAVQDAGIVSVSTGVEGDAVVVRIQDTGCGMSQPQLDTLFDVSWSAEGPRTRMRFGLAAAYATTQQHGGTIDVSSELGEGTTVTFRLPRSNRST